MLYTRLLFVMLLSFMINPILAVQPNPPVENYDSGKVRVANILSNQETGIAAYNKKNIHHAQTLNLSGDLNIDNIAEFFGCKTLIGQQFLAETLKSPVSPDDKHSILANRQHAIRTLVENPELKKKVDQLLEAARSQEQEVIKLMSEFFIGKSCPELKVLELIKQQNPALYPLFSFFNLNPTGRAVSTTFQMISIVGGLALTTLLAKATYAKAKAGVNYTPQAVSTGYFALIEGITSYEFYKDYSAACDKRSKMHALNQLIAIAEKFEKLCAKHAIKNQFNINALEDSSGIQLIQQLKHSRYKNKKQYLFFIPAVHTFLYSLYQQEKHLAEIFACIAEIDAYNAIATKIIESETEKNKLCFVTFIEHEKPMIVAKSFWNILIPHAVTNDLSENKHVILTGPNAGGKTTAIKALLQNIVLAQTFGVAAAQEFNVTMFDVIHSYLKVSDDLLHGLSLFASEVKRAQEVLQTIKSLEPHKKFFFGLDELFTGTVSEDGETCAYEFVKRISEFEGTQFIYATHFNRLKELGKDNDFCINYKVDAPIKSPGGKLIYPFTLTQGANESRVALDLAREAHLFE